MTFLRNTRRKWRKKGNRRSVYCYCTLQCNRFLSPFCKVAPSPQELVRLSKEKMKQEKHCLIFAPNLGCVTSQYHAILSFCHPASRKDKKRHEDAKARSMVFCVGWCGASAMSLCAMSTVVHCNVLLRRQWRVSGSSPSGHMPCHRFVLEQCLVGCPGRNSSLILTHFLLHENT